MEINKGSRAPRAVFPFEVAGRLMRINPEVLKAAARRGEIATVQLNGRAYIPRAELIRLSGGAIEIDG